MSSNHTPEPWSIKPFDDGTFIITDGDDTDDPSNMVIASLGTSSIVEGREAEATANAQLLVNAPKMYEALRKIEKIQRLNMGGGGKHQTSWKIADELLREIDNPKG